MAILASSNRLNSILNTIKDYNIIPDELKVETEQVLLKNIRKINLTNNPRRLNEEDLQYILSENSPIIASVESFIDDVSTILDDNTALGLLDLNGVFFLSGKKDKVGLSCPEAAKLFRNDIELHTILGSGNALEIDYNDGPQSAAVGILDKNGNIPFYVLARNDNGPISSTAWNMLYLAAQLVQQQFFCLEMLNEYTTSFMQAITEPAVILNNNIHITHANQPCLSLLKLDSDIAPPPMRSFKLITQDKTITNINTILNSNPNDQFYIQASNTLVPCSMINHQLIDTPYGKRLILIFKECSINCDTPVNSATEIIKNSTSAFDRIIGGSNEMLRLKSIARQVAKSLSTVLIEGESGTGKELFAEAIHQESRRRGRFVAINCGGIPSELLQSELFGYEEGAFTGAKRGGKKGLFEIADGGTIFLDEIGELPLEMEVSLLRFLQNKVIIPIGGDMPKEIDVRIIAATNRNLKKEVESGNFREDLYYRLNVINLKIPPLRARKEDIPFIADYLLENLCKQYNIPPISISRKGMVDLLHYNWPGNIRELANIIERAFNLRQGKELSFSDILMNLDCDSEVCSDRIEAIGKVEKQVIEKYLRMFNGNVSCTAKALNITRQTLYRKMKALNVDHRKAINPPSL
jgi:Transcriptional regulator containing PAS, AAA-type ATPase, and DNA-binding domains